VDWTGLTAEGGRGFTAALRAARCGSHRRRPAMGGVRLGGVPARAQPGWSRACRAVVELPAGGEQRGEVVEPARICSAVYASAMFAWACTWPAKAPRAQPLHGHPGL